MPLWFPARGSGRFEVSAQLRQSEANERGIERAVCGGGVGAYDRVQRGGAMHARLACVDLLVPVGRDEGGVGVQRDEGRAQRSCEGVYTGSVKESRSDMGEVGRGCGVGLFRVVGSGVCVCGLGCMGLGVSGVRWGGSA